MCHRTITPAVLMLWISLTIDLAPLHAQDVSLPWLSYFQNCVAEYQRSTEEDLEKITQENWPATQALWRSELREMLGLPTEMERTDLNATTVGSLELEGVVVDRLHYQASPGLYVTANLYRPTAAEPEEGWPAVLYVCGHARVVDNGRLLGNKTNYQHHGLWLARHGVVCLTIDTVQLGELHGEHHGTYKLGRWDWISRGYTPAGVEAWNSIRGIDLLTSLPYVNADRIGITGRSGGGAYSWFAAALDDRIKVAVPAAGITDLQNHVVDGCVSGHCDCMYFVNYHGWDYGKLAALVAPRALLLENTDTDSIFPLDGVQRIDRQLRGVYTRLKAQEKYGLVITPGPHKDSQELQVPAFKWLLKHLTGTEPVQVSAANKEIDAARLAVFEQEIPTDEQVTSAPGWFAPSADELVKVGEPDRLERAVELWRSSWMPELQRLRILPRSIESLNFQAIGGGDWPGQANESQADQIGAGPWRLFSAAESPSTPVMLLRVDAGRIEDATPLVHLVLSDDRPWGVANGQPPVFDEAIQSRVRAFPNRRHYFVRWRGAGWQANATDVKQRNQIERRFYLLGQSSEQIALSDYLSALAWISQQSDDVQGLDLAGTGREALLVVLAALISSGRDELLPARVVKLGRFPIDPLLASCIPGLQKVCHVSDLLTAAQRVSRFESFDAARLSSKLLVECDSEPQQANGVRIVEVSQSEATVWVRATRWALPNLGDLPEVQFQKRSGKQSSGVVLPETGVAGLRFGVPGVEAMVRLGHRIRNRGDWQYSEWLHVGDATDYSAIIKLGSLAPATDYEVRTQVKAKDAAAASATLAGSFRTLPAQDKRVGFKLAVGTCQAFPDRDGPHGFDLYRTMLDRGTNAFVMAGDVVYYDQLARSPELAYYHWQRTYSLPTLLEFHRRVPTFFLKDDHDTYVNDSWPGQRFEWTDDFTFEDGQRIFRQETGLPSPAYRTFCVGSDLQVWLMEGRDYRSANSLQDGPSKSIWGVEQKEWLKRTLAKSTSKFKVVISPTPIVGPDRERKRDNHANDVFQTEGEEVRRLLAAVPNLVTVCGDRHWQFHSIDPETKLHEFSVGPASDRHAGGWKQSDFRPEIHQYLRVGGGYLEIELVELSGDSHLVFRHLDTQGQEHHRYLME